MNYEFMGILKPFLPEEVRVKLQEDIKKTVKAYGGRVKDEDVWGKRHLAYKIKGHEEGYYIIYDIEIAEDKGNELKGELRMISDILRFIIVKKEEQ